MWIVRNVLLQMRPASALPHPILSLRSPSNSSRAPHIRYIPAKLPSHRVPGTKAIGPVAEQSRERQELIRAARNEILWAPIERAGISAILRPEL
jgi:hypothetical protein